MISLTDIKAKVCQHYGLEPSAMVSPVRKRKIARPRQIAMYLSHHLTEFSYPRIGRGFGRDHSTVIHAVLNVERLCAIDPAIRNDVRALFWELAD